MTSSSISKESAHKHQDGDTTVAFLRTYFEKVGTIIADVVLQDAHHQMSDYSTVKSQRRQPKKMSDKEISS